MKEGLTQSRLKELLNYDKDTGVFYWNRWMRNHIRPNDRAGCKTKQGYIRIKVDGKNYLAHRLAWLYMAGKFPKEEVDHIDHNESNNLWKNLREVTLQENQKNRKLSCLNTSGFMGVSWSNRERKWVAGLMSGRKAVHLGKFDSFEDAVKAREKANAKYGFHENHGK